MSRIGNTTRWVMVLLVAPPLAATALAQPPARHGRLLRAPGTHSRSESEPGGGGKHDLPPEVLARVAALAPAPAPVPVPVRRAGPLPLDVSASMLAQAPPPVAAPADVTVVAKVMVPAPAAPTPVPALAPVALSSGAAPATSPAADAGPTATPTVPTGDAPAAGSPASPANSGPATSASDGPASPAPAASPAAGTPVSAALAAPSAGGSAAPAPGTLLGRPVPELARDVTRVAAVSSAVSSALGDFLHTQLSSPRVEGARDAAEAPLHDAFMKAGLAWPAARVYLRAFKREHQMEVWGQREDGSYALVKTFAICSLGGSGLGPKIKRGDEQVPEGFYHVIEFNPSSEYHLSLRLDYPNAADLARAGASAGGLGGDIYLHGGCKSAGCLPLTDAGIEQIYWLAVQARSAGERQIPIDIFPARMDAASWEQLTAAFAGQKALIAFWTELKQGYDSFERTHRLPDVAIDANGRYHVALAGR